MADATVWVRSNELGFSAIEVGTAVGYDAVGAVGRVATAAVADDAVIGHEDGTFLEGLKIGVVRGKHVHTAEAEQVVA